MDNDMSNSSESNASVVPATLERFLLGRFDPAGDTLIFERRHSSPGAIELTKVHEWAHRELTDQTAFGMFQHFIALAAQQEVSEGPLAGARKMLDRTIDASWQTHEGWAVYRQRLKVHTAVPQLPPLLPEYEAAFTLLEGIRSATPPVIAAFEFYFVHAVVSAAMNTLILDDIPPAAISLSLLTDHLEAADNVPDRRLQAMVQWLERSTVSAETVAALESEAQGAKTALARGEMATPDFARWLANVTGSAEVIAVRMGLHERFIALVADEAVRSGAISRVADLSVNPHPEDPVLGRTSLALDWFNGAVTEFQDLGLHELEGFHAGFRGELTRDSVMYTRTREFENAYVADEYLSDPKLWEFLRDGAGDNRYYVAAVGAECTLIHPGAVFDLEAEIGLRFERGRFVFCLPPAESVPLAASLGPRLLGVAYLPDLLDFDLLRYAPEACEADEILGHRGVMPLMPLVTKDHHLLLDRLREAGGHGVWLNSEARYAWFLGINHEARLLLRLNHSYLDLVQSGAPELGEWLRQQQRPGSTEVERLLRIVRIELMTAAANMGVFALQS